MLGKILPPPANIAQTAPQHADPQLRTRIYQVSFETAVATVQKTAAGLSSYGVAWSSVPNSGLKPIRAKEETAEQQLHFVVPVLMFRDDLVVTLRGNQQQVVVDVRSQSRVGKGDFGENRRHIIQLLDALDKALPTVKTSS